MMNIKKNALTNYLKESYKELQRVTWPTRQDVINNTIFVVIASVLLALFLGGLDYIFNWLLQLALNR